MSSLPYDYMVGCNVGFRDNNNKKKLKDIHLRNPCKKEQTEEKDVGHSNLYPLNKTPSSHCSGLDIKSSTETAVTRRTLRISDSPRHGRFPVTSFGSFFTGPEFFICHLRL